MQRRKTVITYGTFDMFHIGRLNLLHRSKAMGDKLIVAVSTDEFNLLKGKKVLIPYEKRAKIVESIKCVDMVIPENSWEQKIQDIHDHNVDIFVIGDDLKGKFEHLNDIHEVVYLPPHGEHLYDQAKKASDELPLHSERRYSECL
jgi:glycerol-3-phosphate cytidylyltransferase